MALLEAGYDVRARRAPPGRARGDAPAGHERATVAPADVTDPESVKALFSRRSTASTSRSTTPGPWARRRRSRTSRSRTGSAVLDTNLTGSLLCAQAAIRVMKAQDPRGGRIINNGSISAHAPRAELSPTPPPSTPSPASRSRSLEGRGYEIACGRDRHRQHRSTDMTAPGIERADRWTSATPPTRCVQMAGAPARCQRPVPDDHGDEDALHRPRLTRAGTIPGAMSTGMPRDDAKADFARERRRRARRRNIAEADAAGARRRRRHAPVRGGRGGARPPPARWTSV